MARPGVKTTPRPTGGKAPWLPQQPPPEDAITPSNSLWALRSTSLRAYTPWVRKEKLRGATRDIPAELLKVSALGKHQHSVREVSLYRYGVLPRNRRHNQRSPARAFDTPPPPGHTSTHLQRRVVQRQGGRVNVRESEALGRVRQRRVKRPCCVPLGHGVCAFDGGTNTPPPTHAPFL